MTTSNKYYVGVKGSVSFVFRSQHVPTESSHPDYGYVIGPFRSKRGAEVMARYGHNNPHLQTVCQAERMATRIAWLIQALRAEAAAAGDMAQVAICDLALDGDADAQRECRRVIADAAGAAVQ